MARILIIDDDLMVSRLLEEHLTNEGYEISAVFRAEDGFAAAIKEPPDLIMLDVVLPDATGFQICERFREHPATKSIPIVMMTGAARWPNQQKIAKEMMGATEYLIKPFDVIQVGDRVHQLMGSKRPPQRERLPAKALEIDPVTADEGTRPPLRVEKTGDPVGSIMVEQSPAASPAIIKIVTNPSIFTEDPVGSTRTPLFSLTNQTPETTQPFSNGHTPPSENPVPSHENGNGTHKLAALIKEISSTSQGEDQRFVEFSAEILAFVANRLPKALVGSHVADELLKNGAAAAENFRESQWVHSRQETLAAIETLIKQLRVTGYWLMMIRKSGLLHGTLVESLEKKCERLIAELNQSIAARQSFPSDKAAISSQA